MEQQTKEWYEARNAKFTSSCVYKLITEPRTKEAKERGDLSETAKTYILEKVVEEIGGFIPDFENAATKWGNDNEGLAVLWYSTKTGNPVERVGFEAVNEYYGGSPDRKVMDGIIPGALEVKCPYASVHHLEHCLIDSPEYFKKNHPNYYWQCISHMITLDVKFCDFVSFDPRIDHEIGLFIFRLDYQKEDAELLKKKLKKANEYKEQLKNKLKI